MDYFYCLAEKISNNSVQIDGEEFSHLVHVMRKKVGDEIRVVNGLGIAYDVRLMEIKKKTATGSIRATHKSHNEPSVNVTLAVGVLKNPSRFDFLVEKATEIGVKEIVPLTTERTIPNHAKVDRWQKLALAAMKQSGRSVLPRVKELVSLRDVLDDWRESDVKLVAHERAEQLISSHQIMSPKAKSVVILVGPEGGFTDEEINQCVAVGCVPVSLGVRRLRTETAAIMMAAAVITLSPS